MNLYRDYKSPYLGWKYYEMFKLLINKGKPQKCLKYGNKAREILELYYKSSDQIEEMD